jgi:hypothetical protein
MWVGCVDTHNTRKLSPLVQHATNVRTPPPPNFFFEPKPPAKHSLGHPYPRSQGDPGLRTSFLTVRFLDPYSGQRGSLPLAKLGGPTPVWDPKMPSKGQKVRKFLSPKADNTASGRKHGGYKLLRSHFGGPQNDRTNSIFTPHFNPVGPPQYWPIGQLSYGKFAFSAPKIRPRGKKSGNFCPQKLITRRPVESMGATNCCVLISGGRKMTGQIPFLHRILTPSAHHSTVP